MRTLFLMLLATACQGARPAPATRGLADVEAALLAPRPLRIGFEVVAEGAVAVEVSGTLLLDGGARSRLDVAGTFQGEAVEVTRVCDGQRCGGRIAGEAQPPTAQPGGVREAWVLGFTRMGILHNVAVATGGGAPDHAGGDVGAWLRAENATHDDEWLSFDLVVGGEPSARARLRLGEEGWPARREQSVAFPEGEMRVLETYVMSRPAGSLAGRFEVPEPSHLDAPDAGAPGGE